MDVAALALIVSVTGILLVIVMVRLCTWLTRTYGVCCGAPCCSTHGETGGGGTTCRTACCAGCGASCAICCSILCAREESDAEEILDSTEDVEYNDDQEDTDESDSDTEIDTHDIKADDTDEFGDMDELNEKDDKLEDDKYFSKDVDIHIVLNIEEGDKHTFNRKVHTEESLL